MLTPDYTNRIVDTDASITDLVAFHRELRELEASEAGMLFPIIHTYRAVDIGGGATFNAIEFVNGWRLRFPNPGNYEITGNLSAEILGVAGVFVYQTKALAFAMTSGSGGGGGAVTITPSQVAAAVFDAPTASYNKAGTFGALLNAVMTVGRFFSMK